MARRPDAGAPALVLKPGREKSLLRRHPWVFSGAIGRVAGKPEAGSTVPVRSADGAFLAWAAYSPSSQIRARAWELLLAMLAMEAAFGVAGVIAAPIYYAYIKDELGNRNQI